MHPEFARQSSDREPVRGELRRVLVGAAIMFVALQGAASLLLPRLDLTTTSLLVTALMLVIALVIERGLYGRAPREALRALGWRPPSARGLVAAGAITVGMLAFIPAYALVTGTPMQLAADWPWILVGAVAINGIAEETLFRGFVFGHLRRGGFSFRRAASISLLVFAAVHLFLFTTTAPVVAILATFLAVAAGFPFAFLFERSGMSIWPCVVLHVAAHAFRLVSVPDASAATFASIWLLVQLGAAFLVFAFRGSLLRPAERASE